MKRTIILAALMAIIALMLCGGAVAEEATVVVSGTCGNNLTWELDSEGTLTIEGEGAIPDYDYNNVSGVYSIPWSPISEKIISVVIEDGITSIGSEVFSEYANLTSITIGDGVTSIGDFAISNCYNLANVTIGNSVSTIGEYAFAMCHALTTVNLPDSLTSIGRDAFGNCYSLSEITIPDGVTSIQDQTFMLCSSLNNVTLPENLSSIGSGAFYCCPFSSIDLPNSLLSIGMVAFGDCNNLSSITIPESVTSIDDNAFSGCDALTVNVYKDSYAHTWCGENGVAYEVIVPIIASGTCGNNLTWELDNEGTLTISGQGQTSDYHYTTWPWYTNRSNIISIIIEDGVTSISDHAFYECNNLTNVTIPDSITSIGEQAFYLCRSVSSVYAGSLKNWLNISFGDPSANPMFAAARNSNVNLYFDGKLAEHITIPNTVTSINAYVFTGCSSLTSITIPNSVISIGGYAFEKCINLSSINLPNSVTFIGNTAFNSCDSMTSITIPEGVTSIGQYAFAACDNLTNIAISDSVTSIGDNTFTYGASNKNIVFLGEEMPTIGRNVFTSCIPTIYCYEYSDVDYWALENGYETVYLDNLPLPLTLILPADCTLTVGDTLTVSPSLFPAQDDAVIEWTSSNPEVVSVDNGVLTALSVGEATITAASGSGSDSMVVTTYAEISSFEIPTELWMVTKTTAQLEIENILPAGVTGTFTYASSNTSTLTVDESGLMTGVRPGDAIITVTSNNGIVRTCTVHVCYPVTAIELDMTGATLRAGETVQLTASVTARDQSLVNKLVTFASSDEAVVTVDENGLVTAVAPGAAAVTVSAASGVTAECSVIVTEGTVLTLPADLASIEAEAFANIDAEKVVIPDGCLSIGSRAFAQCEGLCMIVIPDSVTDIAEDAFEDCPNLTISAPVGSRAETYAGTLGIPFIAE